MKVHYKDWHVKDFSGKELKQGGQKSAAYVPSTKFWIRPNLKCLILKSTEYFQFQRMLTEAIGAKHL